MRTINHHNLPLPLLPQHLPTLPNTRLVEIRPARPTPQNNETIRIPRRLRNSRQPLLRHTHEMVLRGRRTDGIHRHAQPTVRSVLEAHWEGETGCEFAVELGLRCSGSDRTQRDEVGEELWADGIQHLRRDGHALVREVAEQFATHSQPLVDLVRLVDVRVVDQALPADGGAGFLEVGAHDDQEVVFQLRCYLDEAGAVFYCCFGVVEGAGPADYEQAVVGLFDDVDGFFAAFEDGGDGVGGCRVFCREEERWY